MYFIKVYKTTSMPDEIWQIVFDTQSYVRHGFAPYTVMHYVKEAAQSDDYPDVEKMSKLDEWLRINGAREDETVLIEHC